MFHKTYFLLFATILASSFASPDANGEAHVGTIHESHDIRAFRNSVQKFAPGLYRIVNAVSGTWARNTPGPGHQGPWRTSIIMTTDAISGYQTWNISHYEEGYRIRNYGSGNSAFSTGNEGDPVQGFSDGLTKWYIESAGENEYRIHYPNKDLVWTLEPEEGFWKTVALEPAQGKETQIFQFF